jgi:hypothetical protein
VKRYVFLLLYAATAFVGATTLSQAPQVISHDQAIGIAESDSGFLGTWVQACAGDGMWHVSAFSKSAKPPVLYVIDATSGKILYRNQNSDVPVSLTGNATNEQDEAMLITDTGFKTRMDGLQRWPGNALNKRVVVTGVLKSKVEPQGTSTLCRARLTLLGAKWKLAK